MMTSPNIVEQLPSVLRPQEEHIFGVYSPHYGRLRFQQVFDQETFRQLTFRCGLPSLWCCWHQGTTAKWPYVLEQFPVVTEGIWQHLNTGNEPPQGDDALGQPQDPLPLLESYKHYYWSTKGVRVTPCTIAEANEYVKKFHRHSAPVHGALFAVQATDIEGYVRGVALVARPIARMLDVGKDGRMKRRIAEVVRVATDTTWNVSSLLYGAARRICKEMGFESIITYTLKEESGTSLRASGWGCVKETGGAQWDAPSRPRRIKAIHAQEKYRWECTLNPAFPFETITRPGSLGEAMPFACHHYLPTLPLFTQQACEDFEARMAVIDSRFDELKAYEN